MTRELTTVGAEAAANLEYPLVAMLRELGDGRDVEFRFVAMRFHRVVERFRSRRRFAMAYATRLIVPEAADATLQFYRGFSCHAYSVFIVPYGRLQT